MKQPEKQVALIPVVATNPEWPSQGGLSEILLPPLRAVRRKRIVRPVAAFARLRVPFVVNLRAETREDFHHPGVKPFLIGVEAQADLEAAE